MTTTPTAAHPTPYAGLRILEMSNDPSGELTGLQFVHMGAEVIKVEPPEGAASRHEGPFVGDVADPDRSLGYWFYNAGKRSVTLDLASSEGRAGLEHLLDNSDLFICTLAPGE